MKNLKNNKMKTTNKIVAMLIGLSTLLFSCDNFEKVIPSSSITTINHQVGSFSGIKVEHAFEVEVLYTTGDEKIVVEANSNIHEFIEVFVSNNQLVIKLRNGVNIKGDMTMRAIVSTANMLNDFDASGASKLQIQGTSEGDNIDISLSGASLFTGDVKSNSLNIYADGASNANLSGTSNSVYVNAEGGCTIGGYGLTTNDTDFRLSGASRASMVINGKIRLTASGASVLMYKGTAVIDQLDLSGGSQILVTD
jgi:hypothetical protein